MRETIITVMQWLFIIWAIACVLCCIWVGWLMVGGASDHDAASRHSGKLPY